MMNPDRWQQIDTVFHTALKSDPDLRATYLDEACVDDPELREEVRTLLVAHEEAGNFMNVPALAIAAALDETDPLTLAQVRALGSFRILSHIATGGMGDVYLAEDSKLDRKIALKVLSADFARDHERVRRFKQEARAASGLNHPNIITIYDIGEEAGIHYIAMEFVEGATIRQRLASQPLSLSEALDITIQAAGALEAAHQAGIVHRDIKPENIMVRPDGYVKVLDFGLAKLAELRREETSPPPASRDEINTEPGMVMGTARYMSPEQARGLELDGRTDVFSLGVVLYEMITGEQPFKGDTAIDAVASMLNTEPPPLRTPTPNAPPALESAVRKAMTKDRRERYGSMGHFLVDLVAIRREAPQSGAEPRRMAASEGGTTIRPRIEATTDALGRLTAPGSGVATGPMPKPGAGRLWILAAVAFVLLIAGFVYLEMNKAREAAPRVTVANSVAVLPFVDDTEDKNDDYLPEGITDSLIDSLSRLSGLRVMSRQAALKYKGGQVVPEAAGRELGVQTVISGQVAKHYEGISISVEIADAAKSLRIWARQYNGTLADILGLEEQISKEVSSALVPELTEAEQATLGKRFTDSSEAYILYLRGLHQMGLRTAEGFRESIDLFRQAAGKDPQYARAYAGLADAYILLSDYGVSSPQEALEQAQNAVAKALVLDENLAEAHTTLGHLKLYYYWDWKDAEAQFKRAIDLEPGYAPAYQGLANYYAAQGRFGEAIAEINTALRYDPLSPNLNQAKGFHLYLAGHYDDAIQQLETTLKSFEDFVPAHVVLGMAYLQKGMNEPALAEFQRCVELSSRSPAYLQHIGRAYAVSGDPASARQVIDEMKEMARSRFVQSIYLARVYTALDDMDPAFKAIEKAVDERDSELIIVKVDPAFEKLRADPRFMKVLGRLSLNQ